MPRYNLLTELESSKFVLNLLDTPRHDDLTRIVQRYTASVIYAIVYGKRLTDGNKDFDEIIEIADSFVKDCYPGAHLVDTFTFLDSLPDFLATWRKEAFRKREWHMSVRPSFLSSRYFKMFHNSQFYRRVAGKVRKAMEANTALDCFTTRLLDHPDFDEPTTMQGAR